uniref:Ig-like domain-containing protein n=1 Tax=Poecilia formosa TaxID=48698 RepID=A0A096LZE1_POEFO
AVLTVEPNWSTFYSGEFVTFTCDRNEAEATDWEYRLNRDNEPYLSINPDKSITLEPLQHSGEFQCCGRRRSSNKTKCSNTVTVSATADRPTATLAAGSTTIPEGGSVTLSCSVEPSAGWKFRWFRRTINTPEAEITTNNIENRNITVTQEGIYRCEGVRGNPAFISHLSNEVTIEIIYSTDKPKAELSSDASKMPVGGRVLLTCSVMSSSSSSSSSDWKYDWYKEQNSSKPLTSQDADFPSNGQMSVSEEGLYWCRGGRGEPVYYTDYSDPISIKTNYPRPAASLSVNPDRVQHFKYGSVSLNCEGNSAEWRLKRISETDGPVSITCSYQRTSTGSTCTINISWSGSRVYWCESKSGEFSNAVNITAQ